jgi:hypothetical protein
VLRRLLDSVVPGRDGALAATLLLDRQSRLFSAVAVLLCSLVAAARDTLAWRLRRRGAQAVHPAKPAPAE